MACRRFKEIFKQYGKVALGVHLSVSAATTAGIYVAVKNNVDTEPLLEKIGLNPLYRVRDSDDTATDASDWSVTEGTEIRTPVGEIKWKNRTAEMAAYSGGALAFAVAINTFLLPVRAPVTVALTPLVVRFLSRRRRIV